MSSPKMNIRSVCDGDGKVLFVESRGDFVDLLLHLTKIPVGSLSLLADRTDGAGAVASIHRSARAMSESMFKDEASLREEAWEMTSIRASSICWRGREKKQRLLREMRSEEILRLRTELLLKQITL